MLPYLQERRLEIEEEIGQPLQWAPNPNSLDKTIVLDYQTDFDDEKQFEEALNWMADYTVKFRKTFARMIKEHSKVGTSKKQIFAERARRWNSDFVDWEDLVEKVGASPNNTESEPDDNE